MNLREALLEVHSKAEAEKIAGYVGGDPERFAELIELLLGPGLQAFAKGQRGL